MENVYIVEFIRLVPNLIVIFFCIYLFFSYRICIDKFITGFLKILDKSQLKTLKFGETSLEFISKSVDDFIFFDDSEKEFIKERLKRFNSYSIVKRVEFVIKNRVSINALWIDDHRLEIMQKRILVQLGIRIEYVDSSEKALRKLRSQKYELILSDIHRGNNIHEGIDFLKRLVENEKIVIPTVFYTSYESHGYSEGNPPYSFGVAYEPYELLLLCLDVLERNICRDSDASDF